MKTQILLLSVVFATGTVFAQGTVNLNNRVTSIGIDAKVLGVNGLGLDGAGYTYELWAGSSVESLAPVAGSQLGFRSGAGAGYVLNPSDVVVTGFAGGTTPIFQVRAWDNAGGTITSYSLAVVRGSSAAWTAEPLGNPNAIPATPSSSLVGLQGFSIAVVPEPTSIALAGIGGLGLLALRRKTV